MYDPDLNAPPVNPLPWVIVLLTGLIGVVELIFQAGEAGFIGGPEAIGWRVSAVQDYAFSDRIFDWMRLNGIYSADNMLRFVSYVFLHQSLMHAVFSIVLALAIGKFVAEIMNPFAVLLIFLLSAAIGAAVYSVFLDEQYAVIGAFPAVYGLLGAFTWLKFTQLTAEGENGLRAFALIIALMAISLTFYIISWLFDSVQLGSAGEWLTRIVGFGVGFALSVVLAPDGKQRLQKALQAMRQR
jgi:membrane associated rhomboid family serine protease